MKNKNMPLFGTNGIRGVFGQDLSLEFLLDITQSLAAITKKVPFWSEEMAETQIISCLTLLLRS